MLCLKLNRFGVMKIGFPIFYCILILIVEHINGAPFLDSGIPIESEIIDPTNRTVWAMFNLTDAQLNRVKAQIIAKNKAEEIQGEPNFENIKVFRINDIRHRLESALKVGSSEENQEHPLHEMAAYPVCSSDSNEASWLHDNNVTIRFSDSLFERSQDNLNLDSAILRLYKYNPNHTEEEPTQNNNNNNNNNSAEENSKEQNKSERCVDPLLDSQIRVTVSIVQQLRRNKRERKKRICNTIMMNVSKTGWVEIDIKRAIYIWENVVQSQNSRHQPILVGWLMIEVHDEEERPLKPGLYFQPPKCDQADFAIPWNFYYGPNTAMPSFKAYDVPRYPRLDVKLIGYAAFAPKTNDPSLHERLRENLRRQLNNESPNVADSKIDNETTLTTSDQSSSAIIMPTDINNLLNNNGAAAATASELPVQVQEQTQQHHQQQQFPAAHLTKTVDAEIEPKGERESEEHIRHHRRTHNGHHHHRHHNHNHHHRHHRSQQQNEEEHQQQNLEY